MIKKGCAIIAVLSAVIGLGVMGYLWYFFSNSYEAQWRQKMVVEINTPSGVKSGEGVLGVDFERGNDHIHAGGSGVKWSITGEAVVVDMGQGKHLFALLKGNSRIGDAGVNASFVFANLTDTAPADIQAIEEVLTLGEAPKDILLEHYPMLVTFADINNPASVKLVDPNDLNSTFGCSADGSSTSDNTVSSGNSSAPWLDAGLTWHAYQKQKAKQEIEQRQAAFYKQRNALDKKIGKLQKEFRALSWKTIAPSGIIKGSEQAAFRKARDELYVSSGYGGKLDPLRKQRVALKANFESKQKALIAAPKKGRSTAKDCYSIKSITLQITDEPLTTGKVESVLGWIWTHAGHLSGQNNEDHSRPELNTTIGDFLKGIKK